MITEGQLAGFGPDRRAAIQAMVRELVTGQGVTRTHLMLQSDHHGTVIEDPALAADHDAARQRGMILCAWYGTEPRCPAVLPVALAKAQVRGPWPQDSAHVCADDGVTGVPRSRRMRA